MSFIRQRGETITAYWETRDAASGKRRQHSKGGFATKKAARDYLKSVDGKVVDGTWRPDQPLTVKQLLEEHWLPAQQSRELRPATIAQYRAVAEHWIVPQIGGLKAAALTPAEIHHLVDTLRTETSSKGRAGLSSRSAQLTVGTLKSACSWAVENGLLGRNPLAGVRRPRAEQRHMTAWSSDQARSFLEQTRSDRLAAAWALLLTRGLRRGELAGLRWEAIDLEGQVLSISRTRVVVDGKAIDSAPKTAASRRTIPLDVELVSRLRAHRAAQSAERLAAGPAYEEGGYVFADELGRPLHPDTISDRFEKLARATGLPRIRLHDLRHTAASLMLASGVPTKVVSDLLGHASPTITLGIYAHVLPGMAEEAGAALSASLLK